MKRHNCYKAVNQLITIITDMLMMCVLFISRGGPLDEARIYFYFHFRFRHCYLQHPTFPVYAFHSLLLFQSHQISLHTVNQTQMGPSSCLYVNEGYIVSAPDKPQIPKVTVTAPGDSHPGSLHVTWQVGTGSSQGQFCICLEICQLLLKQMQNKLRMYYC